MYGALCLIKWLVFFFFLGGGVFGVLFELLFLFSSSGYFLFFRFLKVAGVHETFFRCFVMIASFFTLIFSLSKRLHMVKTCEKSL